MVMSGEDLLNFLPMVMSGEELLNFLSIVMSGVSDKEEDELKDEDERTFSRKLAEVI